MSRAWHDDLSAALKKAKRLVILGVGNEQKGDDAAGSLCVRMLQKKAKNRAWRDLCILNGGEVPENLTGKIREFEPTHVLIIDAVLAGYKPGTIFLVNWEKIRPDDLSTHRIPLSHLIRYLEESVGCRVIFLGIEPKQMEEGQPISAAIKRSAEALAESLLRIWTKEPRG